MPVDREIVVVDDGVDALSQRRDAVRDDLPDTLDVGLVAQRETFEIDEETICGLVVAEALFERDRQNVIAQFHRAGGEDARVHQDRRLRHQRFEIHFPEDVILEIDRYSIVLRPILSP